MSLRRNDIVWEKQARAENWSPYGRVVRRIDPQRVEVVFSTQDFSVMRDDDLERVEGYQGYSYVKNGKDRYHRMPSLRRLKQRAARFDKTIWRRFREP